MSTSDAEENRPVSPDSQCRICLGKLKTKCIADSNCFHQFCLSCLMRWSEVKAECPLCKRPFKKIIYNMKVSGEYDFHEVRPPPASPELLSMPQIQIPGPSDVIMIVSFRGGHLIQESLGGSMGVISIMSSGAPIDRETTVYRRSLAFRQSIYAQRLWVHDINQFGQPVRECNPTYFRANRSHLSRLRPWLKRELAVFLPYGRRVAEMTENVLELMTRYNIDSRDFRNAVAPVIGERFDHFLHELRSFARSFYDMSGFDENAVYNPARVSNSFMPPASPDSDDDIIEVTPSSNHVEQIVLSDSDSDVELIEPSLQEIILSSSEENHPPRRHSGRHSVEITEISPSNHVESNDSDPSFEPTPSTSSCSKNQLAARKSSRYRRNPKSLKSSKTMREASSSNASSSSYNFKKEMLKRIDGENGKKQKGEQREESYSTAKSQATSSSSRSTGSISRRTRRERREKLRSRSVSSSDSGEMRHLDSKVKRLKKQKMRRLNRRRTESSESSSSGDEAYHTVKRSRIRQN